MGRHSDAGMVFSWRGTARAVGMDAWDSCVAGDGSDGPFLSAVTVKLCRTSGSHTLRRHRPMLDLGAADDVSPQEIDSPLEESECPVIAVPAKAATDWCQCKEQ